MIVDWEVLYILVCPLTLKLITLLFFILRGLNLNGYDKHEFMNFSLLTIFYWVVVKSIHLLVDFEVLTPYILM